MNEIYVKPILKKATTKMTKSNSNSGIRPYKDYVQNSKLHKTNLKK